MNILHVIPSYYPAFKFGGPIESVHSLNKCLVTKGVNVCVITTNAGLEKRNDIRLNEWINQDGVLVKYSPYYFYVHYTFSPRLFLESLSEVRKYDLVHITAFWNFPVLAGSIACLANNKPYIISPRGVLYPGAIDIRSRYIKQLYYYFVANHYLRNAGAIHFTTEDERDKIARFIKICSKTVIVPNGVDLNQYKNLPIKGSFKRKYPILQNKRYVLFLGRINKQKGLMLLYEAFEMLSKEENDIYLVIAGPDDGYLRESKEILRKKSLLDKTLFTGMLLREEKLSALVDCEVFILPSYFENFGMSVVEAMACKTPVVISNKVGIFNDIEQANSGIVVSLKAEDLFKSIRTLLKDNELRERIIINGSKLLQEKYDIRIIADKMIKVYEEVLSGVK